MQTLSVPYDRLAVLQRNLIDYALGDGLLMVPKEAKPGHAVHVPMSCYPTMIPRQPFEFVQSLSIHYNTLVDKASRDSDFLINNLKQSAITDDFLHKLLEVFQAAKPIQVELNVISAAFAGLGTKVVECHRYTGQTSNTIENFDESRVPKNTALPVVSAAIAAAVHKYSSQPGLPELPVVVLTVVQPGERNVFDQKCIEYELWRAHGIRTVRKTLAEINAEASLGKAGALVFPGFQAAVAYFRAGYGPRDYPSEAEWTARLTVENSLAIKCPTLGYQLVGCKKIQQVLADPGVVERFLNAEAAAAVRRSWTGLYSLSEPANIARLRPLVEAKPRAFVMKPQREGGGNLLANEAMVHALQNLSELELSAYILMDRISPPDLPTHLLRDGEVTEVLANSELGIFSTFLGDGKVEEVNSYAGFLLRTKGARVEDGGVAAGVAVLDSPYLYDQ